MNPIIEKVDNEFIFDTEHIIMNFLKMNKFNPDILKDTDIKISPNINIAKFDSEFISNSIIFASNYYFLELTKKEGVIDLLIPLISNYPNSNLSLFLTVILNQHIIEISPSLNSTLTLFKKYEGDLKNLYHNVFPKEKKAKLLENICASITVLIIIGFQEHWCNGIDRIIEDAKKNNGNYENNVYAALILSNVENIYKKLEDKIDIKSYNYILSAFGDYSEIITVYLKFLITNSFSGEKQNFANGELFKAFIGILLCDKYFKINIIKMHGLLEFIIDSIFYVDINEDFIIKICDLFDNTFQLPNDNKLKYDFRNNYKINDFINFLNEIPKNEDFQEIFKCIKLIENMKNFYINKNINEIKNNSKDMQILFASCNIFNSICENYGYIFILPELDDIIQDIFLYFINIPIPKINKLLISSLNDLFELCQNDYKFQNYDNNIREKKMIKLNNFLYSIQNTVLQYMNLSSNELNTFQLDNKSSLLYRIPLDQYIDNTLKNNINDDDKTNLIEISDDFYNNIFDIVNNFFSGEDYCNKLLTFIKNSITNKDFATVHSLMNVFIMLKIRIMNYYPNIYYALIEYIFENKEILFTNKRFILQFIELLYKLFVELSKNKKYLNLVLENLVNNNIIKSLNCEIISKMIIILINKLILTSYQTIKVKWDGEELDLNSISDNDKNALNNIFNILSKFLLDNLNTLDHYYLYKIIDAFYNSLFLNITINITNKDSIYTASEKLFSEANQLLAKSDNINGDDENIIKYFFIIWSVIKNLRNENKEALYNLLNNKNDPFYNPPISYLVGVQNNILKYIKESNNTKFNENIFNAIILLSENLIAMFRQKAIELFDYFNQIISLIISSNPKYTKVYNLTYILYAQIFTYNQGSEKYNMISQIGFDILNSINNIYNSLRGEEETVSLANIQLQILILYIQKSPHFINNLNKEVFMQSINYLITIFSKSNEVEFTNNFMKFFKLLTDLSINNNVFETILKNNFIDQLLKSIIDHITYFKGKCAKCNELCFDIFKNCIQGGMEENFRKIINEIYNDKEITEVIAQYVIFLKNNTNMKKATIDKKGVEFISDINDLIHAMNRKRKEFVKKYVEEINNVNFNEDNLRKHKVDKNMVFYENLVPK